MKKILITFLSITVVTLSLFGLFGQDDKSVQAEERGVFPSSIRLT